jgi:2-desacetyl-2-hydroxyethyl bacteriochlorophyllide A dehydrogenase
VVQARTRAAVLGSPRRLDVVDRPRPVAGPGEVLVQVAATALCHTDLEIWMGRHPNVRYPVVPGHEATGVVEGVGPGVTRVGVGRRVLINPIIACGACEACARGRGNLCSNGGLLGRELDGSLSEHIALPERYLHPLPDHLPLALATLIETLATVLHAQRRAAVVSGESVVVLGQGAAGLMHTWLAKHRGAAPVIAVSRSGWKLDLARRMGADHVVMASGDALVGEVRRLTAGLGADVVIEAAGSPELVGQAIAMLRPGGRLLIYAVSHRPVPDFSTFSLYFKELTLVGSRALLPEDVEPAVALAASGAVPLDGFVTGTYPLDRAAAAFERYEGDPERALRMIVVSEA